MFFNIQMFKLNTVHLQRSGFFKKASQNTIISKYLSESLQRLLHRICPAAINRRSTAAELGNLGKK